MIEKDFLEYNDSLQLKQLGFNEPCWCYFLNGIFNDSMFPKTYEYFEDMNKDYEYILAPLLSQVFRWFRVNYGLEHSIIRDSYGCRYQIIKKTPTSIEEIDCKNQLSNTSYDDAEYNCIKRLINEVKGEKHSSSKVKTLAAVDTEKLESIQSFVDYAVTESRFKQALENVFPNEEPIENKKLGDVIRWVVNDVVKEEMDTMLDNGIEPKDVNKYISSKVRDMFFKLV